MLLGKLEYIPPNEREFHVGEIVQMFETENEIPNIWTIREKRWHKSINQYVYFMTMLGYDGWFTHENLNLYCIAAIAAIESTE